tara:strand:- start:139 stop:1158 length:1020 start_codon:yes stop_codon:yes gene_type:complete
MATLKVNTLSGIGTEGPVLSGGLKFRSENYMTLPKGNTNQRDNDGGGRGVFGGGEVPGSPGTTDTIDYVEFATQGNAVDFGNLSQSRRKPASVSSSTRGIFAGGATPSATDRIDFVTISSTGDATDFGNLLSNSDDSSQCFGGGNDTRGIFAGGYNDVNVIQFITNASTGDATDFGDLLTGRFDHAGFASPTRAFFAGGKNTPASPDTQINIEFVTIATTGNGTVFGEMAAATRGPTGASSNTRGLMAANASGGGNSIEYITMATAGNTKQFGDLTVSRSEILAGGTSNNVRALFASGSTTNVIDFVIIASEGNAIDFGDLTVERSNTAGVSNAHGGLS